MKGIAKKALDPSNIAKHPSLVNSISDFIKASKMSTSDMLASDLRQRSLIQTAINLSSIPRYWKIDV